MDMGTIGVWLCKGMPGGMGGIGGIGMPGLDAMSCGNVCIQLLYSFCMSWNC